MSRDKSYIESYKTIVGEDKDITSVPVGELQKEILNYVWSEGIKRFKLSFLKHLADRRRLHDAVMRLVKRGLVKRIAHGWYEVLVSPEITKLIVTSKAKLKQSVKGIKDVGKRPKDKSSTRESSFVFSFGGVSSFGVPVFVFDNVRGFLLSSDYVGGDRGCRLGFEDLARFGGVSYCEPGVAFLNNDDFVVGQVVIYSSRFRFNGEVSSGVVVEWRPPSGFVKKYGVAVTHQFFRYEVLVRAWVVLTYALRFALGSNDFGRLFRRILGGAWGNVVRGLLRVVC